MKIFFLSLKRKFSKLDTITLDKIIRRIKFQKIKKLSEFGANEQDFVNFFEREAANSILFGGDGLVTALVRHSLPCRKHTLLPPSVCEYNLLFFNYLYFDFCSNINPRTKEILFEVYSKSKNENEKNEFLGLAIVSVQELLESPSQRQVISLQSRPYQNDRVSGTLTLEVRTVLYIVHIFALISAPHLHLVFNSSCNSPAHTYYFI